MTQYRWPVVAAGAAALTIIACLLTAQLEPTSAFSLVAREPIMMKLRRTCYGCPNYTITLWSDGRLIYEGRENTRVRGVHTFRVPPDVVMDVLADFTHPDFLELENIYPAPGIAWIVSSLTVEMNGMSKSVLSEDRFGPAVLLSIERKMDNLPGMRTLSGWTR